MVNSTLGIELNEDIRKRCYSVLNSVLCEYGVPLQYYYLGEYMEDYVCVEYVDEKWIVYEGSRGRKLHMKTFVTFYDASCSLFKSVVVGYKKQREMSSVLLTRLDEMLKRNDINSRSIIPLKSSSTRNVKRGPLLHRGSFEGHMENRVAFAQLGDIDVFVTENDIKPAKTAKAHVIIKGAANHVGQPETRVAASVEGVKIDCKVEKVTFGAGEIVPRSKAKHIKGVCVKGDKMQRIKSTNGVASQEKEDVSIDIYTEDPSSPT